MIPDKKCIKYARDKGITVRSLIDDDDKALREQIFEAVGEQKRELQEKRNCVINAKDLYNNYLKKFD